MTISPDGTRLVTTVAALSSDKAKYVTSVWDVDPSGGRPARRLTRSAKGESAAAFLPTGDLLFTSARSDPDNDADDDEPAMLWLLPATGGEARVVAKRPGGIADVKVAREAGTIVVTSSTFPSSTDVDSEEAKRKERKDKKISAILHESYPVRFWDHDLGPDAPRLFVGTLGGDDHVELRDLTPDAGSALVEASYDVSSDGTTVVTSWNVPEGASVRPTIVAIDVASGERRTLLDDENCEFYAPAISPDGTMVAAIRETLSSPTEPPDISLVLVSLADGSVRDVAADWDRWPSAPVWAPDDSALLVSADDDGRGPVFRIDVATDAVTKLTSDDAAFTDVVVSPDGAVYALRTSYRAPSAPVRLAHGSRPQPTVALPSPSPDLDLPGTLTEVSAVGEDGTTLRAWLALPSSASADDPAPLLLWVHGGPLASWNAWSWRWNPWLMVARGYAVVLPDPAMSTGYGRDFIARGWGNWGQAPFTDLMAITDAAAARADIDASRTAAMGGSFGGYMANWIAGNTQRFDAIVTHASLWALEQFNATTDAAWYWEREMTAEMAAENSPHRHVDKINTPMLVVHGDMDYRVPIGEGLRLWWELTSRWKGDGDADTGMPHRFLYFPDENHWVLSPQHAKVWYDTVLAFLAHHVLGEDWTTPDVLH